MRDTSTRRRTLAPIAAAIACALAAAVPVSAQSPPGDEASASAGVSGAIGVELTSASQRAILARGVRVRVTSGAAGAVALAPRLKGPGGAARIGRRRIVSFARPGTRTLALRLHRRGAARIAACAGGRIVVRARLLGRDRAAGPAGSPRTRVAAPLALDSERCAASGTPGGGSGGGSGGGGPDGDGGGGVKNGNVIPPQRPYDGPAIGTANASRCDFLDGAVCLQPWPNDYFTAEDPGTDTGRRINLDVLSMPASAPGGLGLPVKPIDPAEHNRNDGFSPGNMLVTKVPGLSTQEALEQAGVVSIDHPERYDDPGQPVVVINAATGERHPVWAEIDSNPADPADRNLIVRPLVNFDEGARYVVAIRGLLDDGGDPVAPAEAFRVYRDNLLTAQPEIEARRAHMEELFEIAGRAGIERAGLYLAWDFTVASERNLSERMLSIRDRAFAGLGDTDLADGAVQGSPPAISDVAFEDFTAAEDPRIARTVTGKVTVPCFLTANCAPVGARYSLGPDGLPTQNGSTTAEFTCIVPRSALDGPDPSPARISLYGHGLLGAGTEVEGANVKAMAAEHNIVFCATDWYGFATQNILNILAILQDLSLFPLLADGSQQGFLNFLFLGRAMLHPQGLASNPAFQTAGGEPIIDTSDLYYDGNSQGGILGGGLTAVAPDFDRAVLGVPGMNYSTLLRRSVDFEPYAEGQFGEVVEEEICEQANAIPVAELSPLLAIVVEACVLGVPDDTPLGLYDNYPNELERPLILSLMQMLWDRAEANGYAHHMTDDPLPNTPPHDVLLHAAFGDHQVANVTAEVEARTIGASVYQPALDTGRHWQSDGELFGIPSIGPLPFGGSALVYWDGGPLGFPGGTATPPNGNIPPRPEDGYGADPHSYPRNDVKGRAQKSAFLSEPGVLLNFCTAENNVLGPGEVPVAGGEPTPCYAHGYPGP